MGELVDWEVQENLNFLPVRMLISLANRSAQLAWPVMYLKQLVVLFGPAVRYKFLMFRAVWRHVCYFTEFLLC